MAQMEMLARCVSRNLTNGAASFQERPMTDEEFENMNGFDAEALETAVLSDDASRTRIIFRQAGNRFFFELPTAELAAFMPILSKAANAAHSGDERLTITAKDASAVLDTHGHAMVTLVNTADAEMTFGLELRLAHKLSDELQKGLLALTQSTATH